ncbi:hypothetical protein, partial [Stenotrophomonas pictorum]|uniref:hypothetical protein n=1 Tax=Stenotrophomonas pictorum TaxID=86184 RepID=UPI0012FD4E75
SGRLRTRFGHVAGAGTGRKWRGQRSGLGNLRLRLGGACTVEIIVPACVEPDHEKQQEPAQKAMPAIFRLLRGSWKVTFCPERELCADMDWARFKWPILAQEQ